MGTAVMTNRLELNSAASSALQAAAGFWFVVAVIGQWAFFYYIVAFYGPSTFSGNFHAWSKNTFLHHGYIAGDTAGNLVFASHALLAGIIAFGGALQLLPQIRTRAIAVHRWVGRVFMVTALGLGVSGLYITWLHGARPKFFEALPIDLNAVLIIAFVGLAWRTAATHQIAAHRRWALRTYLVANAQWFTRVGFLAWMIVSRSVFGASDRYDNTFFTFLGYGCFLVPLAVLEFYLRAKESRASWKQFAMSGVLVALTLLMGAGIFGVASLMWLPLLKAMK
jgi:uncharacterized membrane protein